jgi:hypothetical protein
VDAPHPTSPSPPADWEAFLAALTPPPCEFDEGWAPTVEAVMKDGEVEGDACERLLGSAARICGALDVATAEGLHALRAGDHLPALGCHLDDYAREVLDLGKRSAESLAALGAGLASRELLREALRSGRVRLRAAQTILPVAQRADEAA